MAQQEAAQNIILPEVVVPRALPAAEPREAKGAAALLRDTLCSLGLCLGWFCLSINRNFLLQAQRQQKVQQAQLCEPVPAVPLLPRTGTSPLPTASDVVWLNLSQSWLC